MPIILCVMNQFAIKQLIYVMDKETNESKLIGEVETNDIGRAVVSYSNQNNLNEIIFVGANKEYLNQFVDEVYTINDAIYGEQNQLNVYVLE